MGGGLIKMIYSKLTSEMVYKQLREISKAKKEDLILWVTPNTVKYVTDYIKNYDSRKVHK